MKENFINKIKLRGYWRINFQPMDDNPKFDTFTEIKESVEKSLVRLRGWDYPHLPQSASEDTGTEPCGEYFQGWVDWANHKEFWRMYKSGQFLHYLALREDWLDEDSWHSGLAEKIKPGTKLGVIGSVVYQITEIFEFLSRLGTTGIYNKGINVSISLGNIKNRELWVESDNRAPFLFPYKTGAEKITINRKLSKDEILFNHQDIATNIILEVFDNFLWNPTKEMIKKEQDDFLSGRF